MENEENTAAGADTQDDVIRIVEEAAPHMVAIGTEIAEAMKDVATQYVTMKVKSDDEIKSIWQKRARDRTKEEKDELKAFVKSAKQEFKTLCSLLFPANPMSNPLAALAAKVAMVVRMLRYVGIRDFDDVLAKNGMTVEATGLEEESPFWESDSSRELAKDIVSQAEAVHHRKANETAQIREVKYQELPEQCIKTPQNPSGISVAQFAKMVRTKAVALTSSGDEYTAYKDRLVERDAGALESAAAALDIIKAI